MKHDFAYAGVVHCGHCGCLLVGEQMKRQLRIASPNVPMLHFRIALEQRGQCFGCESVFKDSSIPGRKGPLEKG
jgi:hypothetical protein